jgi:hypothetical protein
MTGSVPLAEGLCRSAFLGQDPARCARKPLEVSLVLGFEAPILRRCDESRHRSRLCRDIGFIEEPRAIGSGSSWVLLW